MAKYLFLERFNNYFNRKIIKYSSVADYKAASLSFVLQADKNFKPNDNISTEIIANDVSFDPDYILILDDKDNIVSRWFIIEMKRNRQGQWLYQLKRDVIADNLDNLLDAPIYMEKAMLKENDPFIVNSEGMSFNQIKKSEKILQDKSRSSWIVGYMAKNIGGTDIPAQAPSENIKFEYNTLESIAEIIGASVGDLASLINIGDDQSNVALFTQQISIRTVAKKIEDEEHVPQSRILYVYDVHMAPDFESGSPVLVSATRQFGPENTPYLFKTDLLSADLSSLGNYFYNAIITKKALWKAQIKSILNVSYLLTDTQLQALYAYNGTYIKYNGEYYKLNISEIGSNQTNSGPIAANNLYTAIDETAAETVANAPSAWELSTGTYNPAKPFENVLNYVLASNKQVVISLKYLSSSDTIPQLDTVLSSGRNVTEDQEYDIFAIPLNMKISNNGTTFETIDNYSRRIASAIGLKEDAKVYDLQLLPFCPIPDLVSDINEIDITDLTEHEQYDLITKNISDTQIATGLGSTIVYTPDGDEYDCQIVIPVPDIPAGETPNVEQIDIPVGEGQVVSEVSHGYTSNQITINFHLQGTPDLESVTIFYSYPQDDTPCGIIFYVTNSSFSTVIEHSIEPEESLKVISNCYMWRLVSPNYQGAFEFNVAKNGGKVTSFNVFCTYKPYTPTLKVAPNFEWLYGMEFQDNRGLICGGDFSLPRAADAWVTYQLNNKNYQNIFNREIQHMDYMQGLEMRNQIVSGAVGILGDAAKGAAAGAYVGQGPIGAAIGGIIGAGASAIGYGIDIDTLARTHRENRQLAIDKFNYQLGNIKALPYTLTKIGSFDVISKIFPFIEEYCCSDKELGAFKSKIKYESMTVMRIGTLREHVEYNDELNYFKGSLIRNDQIADDTHVLNAIYEELLKGVYI